MKLEEVDKELLRRIKELTEQNPYPPIPSDLVDEGESYANRYSTLQKRLYRLEKMYLITMYRDSRGRIRMIKLADIRPGGIGLDVE